MNLLRGERADAVAAGSGSAFTARLSDAQCAAFDAQLPSRFAFKHAHSRANPEADWGLYVQQSVQIAFWLLNQHFAPATTAAPYPINRTNTLVIASSVSNGGRRIAAGLTPVQATGSLRGIPAIWVTGRNDGILPPNFTGRANYGLTQVAGGNLTRYYEVTNAQHLDSFNQFPGFNETLVPLHVYFLRAMDMMPAHLRSGTPLPPSQVVQTTPRGPGAPALTAANVPPIQTAPAAGDLIGLAAGVLTIPD